MQGCTTPVACWAPGRRVLLSTFDGTDCVSQCCLYYSPGYDHDEAWLANMELFKELTDVAQVDEMEGYSAGTSAAGSAQLQY